MRIAEPHSSRQEGHTWALVLAAGEGSRLRSLTTTPSGLTVPKQFCSLTGRSSLLDDTLRRAHSIVDGRRVCAVVAAHHRHWWDASLSELPAANVIVQPLNKGTANGILLPLLHILEQDANATIIILPSDHHVRHEAILRRACLDALAASRDESSGIILLGVDPEGPDDELGYIVPGAPYSEQLSEVARFVEKPPQAEARVLIANNGLWNVFILAARGATLLRVFEEHYPSIVREARALVRLLRRGDGNRTELGRFYEGLPQLDFSRHVAEVNASRLRVLRVPRCGWSDLGTPKRVRAVLRSWQPRCDALAQSPLAAVHVNLAVQCARADGML